MIAYITIGSNDLDRSAAFFDTLFGALNGERAYSLDKMVAYRFANNSPMILVTRPFDDNAAMHGNGTMIALSAKDRPQVNCVHALALELGGTDEGAPGSRGKNFYGGYFRDPDGNKFNICVTS